MTKPTYLIYLGSPYQHENPDIIRHRVRTIRSVTLTILNNVPRLFPYSPISYSHTLADGVPKGFDWLPPDKIILSRCDAGLFSTMKGYRESKGMREELDFCRLKDIPIFWSPPNVDDVLSTCGYILEVLDGRMPYKEELF